MDKKTASTRCNVSLNSIRFATDKGAKAYWQELEEATYTIAYKRFRRAGLQTSDAEDEARNIAMTVMGSLDTIRDIDAWVQWKATCRLADLARARKRRTFVGYDDEALKWEISADGNAEETFVSNAYVHWVLHQVSLRRPACAGVARLHIIEGLTFDEIGKRLNKSPSTCRVQWGQAVQTMRELFKLTAIED